MNLIQGARKKAVLPKVAATPVQPIDILAVSEVRWADGLRQRILRSGRPHEMDVIGHKAIAKQAEAEALAVFAEEFEVRTAVVIHEENILTIVAALNNVVRLSRNDDSGHARHDDNLPLAGRKVNK